MLCQKIHGSFILAIFQLFDSVVRAEEMKERGGAFTEITGVVSSASRREG